MCRHVHLRALMSTRARTHMRRVLRLFGRLRAFREVDPSARAISLEYNLGWRDINLDCADRCSCRDEWGLRVAGRGMDGSMVGPTITSHRGASEPFNERSRMGGRDVGRKSVQELQRIRTRNDDDPIDVQTDPGSAESCRIATPRLCHSVILCEWASRHLSR